MYKETDFKKIEINTDPPLTEPERQYYYIALCRELVRREAERLGRPLTCCVTTFGCQMNARDSEKLTGILKEAGFATLHLQYLYRAGECQFEGLRASGPFEAQKKKQSFHAHRTLRLYDAGAGGGGEVEKKLPVRRSHFRYSQYLQICGASGGNAWQQGPAD